MKNKNIQSDVPLLNVSSWQAFTINHLKPPIWANFAFKPQSYLNTVILICINKEGQPHFDKKETLMNWAMESNLSEYPITKKEILSYEAPVMEGGQRRVEPIRGSWVYCRQSYLAFTRRWFHDSNFWPWPPRHKTVTSKDSPLSHFKVIVVLELLL